MITTNMLILKDILLIVIPIIIILLIWEIFKKMKNKKVAIIAIVLLVIVVAIITTIIIGQNSNNQYSNTSSISQQQTFKEEIKKEFDLAKKRCEAKAPIVTIFGIEEELKNVYGEDNVKAAMYYNNVVEIKIKKDGMTAYVDANNNVRIK